MNIIFSHPSDEDLMSYSKFLLPVLEDQEREATTKFENVHLHYLKILVLVH